jgi:hypothetical protein
VIDKGARRRGFGQRPLRAPLSIGRARAYALWMDPKARADFPDFVIRCGEGSTDFAYPDELGNITIADGNLEPTLASFAQLDWRNPDGSVSTANQVQTAWLVLQGAASIVRANGKDRWPGGSYFAKLTTIRAPRASLDALIESRIDQFENTLRAFWPGYDDDPGPAQEGLMRVCWAVGPGRLDVHWPTYWPKLHAAWCAKNWAGCAQECRIPSLDATEPAANALESALFLSCIPAVAMPPA